MCGRDDDAEGVKVTIGKPPCRVCRREPPETNTSMRVRNRRMECRLDSGKGIPSPFCQRRCILPYRSHRRQRQRLGDVLIHADRLGGLYILGKGVGGHGDNRHTLAVIARCCGWRGSRRSRSSAASECP